MNRRAYSVEARPPAGFERRIAWMSVTGAAMPSYANALLNALDEQVVDRLQLRPAVLDVEADLEVPGTPIRKLYFLEHGMASVTTAFRDGSQVEVGMFGCESVIGISALMGSLQSLNRIFMQVAGRGYTCTVASALVEFQRGEAFQKLALRYVQAQLLQSMQSTGCNAKHEVQQRLARWLLLCMDRTNQSEFFLPQEFLAEMLGTRRTTVTMAASGLKRAGLIDYSRGRMVILNAKGLEDRACECYGIIRNYLNSVTGLDRTTTHAYLS